jgi:hypothetical protein
MAEKLSRQRDIFLDMAAFPDCEKWFALSGLSIAKIIALGEPLLSYLP